MCSAISNYRILLVDDDDVDAEGVRRSFAKLKIDVPIVRARDGLEALEMLRSGDVAVARPLLVLLDLNMPRMNGIEFLQAVRADSELRDLIVFVLTTSKADEDRMRAYDNNVAGYIVKADAGRAFLKAAEMIEKYGCIIEFP